MFPKIFLPAALIVYYDISKENVNKSFVLRNLLIISLKTYVKRNVVLIIAQIHFCLVGNRGKHKKIS